MAYPQHIEMWNGLKTDHFVLLFPPPWKAERPKNQTKVLLQYTKVGFRV
jgi:hypothetical protein